MANPTSTQRQIQPDASGKHYVGTFADQTWKGNSVQQVKNLMNAELGQCDDAEYEILPAGGQIAGGDGSRVTQSSQQA